MALTIFWTKRADKKFDKIIGYLEQEWGDAVTKAFVRKVYDFFDILVEYPELGSIENADRKIPGFVIVKQLTIFYKIKDEKIILLNFFDNRQNPKRKK